MNSLDPRSLLVMGVVMMALMTIVMVLLRRHYPDHIRGLGNWSLALLAWLVSGILFAARGQLSPLLSMVAANSLLLFGGVLYYMGCRRFYDQPPQWRLWLAVLAAQLLVYSFFTYVRPKPIVLLVIVSVTMIAINAANLRFLWRVKEQALPQRLVQVVLAAHIAALVMRLATAPMGGGGDRLLQASPYQTLYIGSYVLAVLLLAVGAILMASDRITREMQWLATHDPLTDTLNRRALVERGARELSRSQRHKHALALLMIDLDHFKRINDRHGHQHGDAVLRHFTQKTQAQLRGADLLGRWGGEEFMLLLPETDAAQAGALARRIHEALAQGHALDCRFSVGLTTWQGAQDTLDAMIARADAALYEAKEQGRNRTCIG